MGERLLGPNNTECAPSLINLGDVLTAAAEYNQCDCGAASRRRRALSVLAIHGRWRLPRPWIIWEPV